MAAGVQHSFRVTAEVKAAFAAYAKRLEVQESELVRILILRERRHQRLKKIVSAGARVVCGSSGNIKVTAHFPSTSAAEKFHAYANECDLGPGRAGAWLIETELDERWFENALGLPPVESSTTVVARGENS